MLRRNVAASGAPGLLATALNDIFGFFRGAAVPYLRGGVELLIEGVSVLVMAIYLARHPGVYIEGIVAIVPPQRRRLAHDILADLGITLRAWVVGQVIAMVFLGGLTTLGLWALGVPYFLAFGVFAGVAAIVPSSVLCSPRSSPHSSRSASPDSPRRSPSWRSGWGFT